MQYSLKFEELPNLSIESLGAAQYDSPLKATARHIVDDSEKVQIYSHNAMIAECIETLGHSPAFELGGPREKIYFNPSELNCGIVTCGGLCPGLNDVIRTITLTLAWQYKVRTVYGFRYGYAGLSSNAFVEPMILTPKNVDNIHTQGGSMLASSRGPQDIDDMIDHLLKLEIGLLFVIGGDGTLRGAQELAEGVKKRNLKIGVVGVPKTIDNDILGVERSFGFSSAVEEARTAILGAFAHDRRGARVSDAAKQHQDTAKGRASALEGDTHSPQRR